MELRPTFKTTITKFGRTRQVRTIDAIKDVSFDLMRGSTLGIVGNNGAGKTSLISALSGILPPAKGRIEVHGRVNTVLALGVGFNDGLSGHENVILGGLAAGYSRAEITAKSQEIADWTELGDFLEMPIKTYSAGMRARLGFAVAAHMDPDILIIDEALSTGDASFKAKAMTRMKSMQQKAQTMVLVSHALATIKDVCSEALWLEKGSLQMFGPTDEVIEAYTTANKVNAKAVTTQNDF